MPSSPTFQFHPAVARWLEQRFGTPTEPQQRGWPAIQSGAHTLIAAPTGSGKTLAAFLASLDQLFRDGLAGNLADETRVLYVSPLKALSNDIHKNLEEPLSGIRAALHATTGREIDVRAAVRTGDTPAAKRQAMLRRPPHILVTTPESFYLLLTSPSGRKLLSTVRELIVDEIHAVVSSRRGSHLALSMERLAALVRHPLQRIGLSATQKPIEEVARFLVGTRNVGHDGHARCQIVDCGYRRELDLAIELPGSPLEAVMSNEVWTEVYSRLAELIEAHRTTLVFVNTRRLAERVTHQLAGRLGAGQVMSHHGSLSAALRHEAEHRLKRGELRALVATASLELGIDIGSVDLVCQIGPTRSIATFLQRVGRAEHRRGGLPKGRIFPLSRDELVECVATLRSIAAGELDRLEMPQKPLDLVAQQIVACAATDDWEEDALFDLMRSAWPYRALTRDEFDDVLRMLAEGFSTRRGRRGALIHHDAINHRVRARRGAQLVALTSGGAIPDNADYRVLLEPGETFIGTVNEDFAVESMAGDIFQLGNASWRILGINSGVVRVEDAHGQPPGIPFWLGEAPGRTVELSQSVSRLRADVERVIEQVLAAVGPALAAGPRLSLGPAHAEGPADERQPYKDPAPALAAWLAAEAGLAAAGARQLADYFVATHRALGVIPSQDTLVLERFFDESGGMQLVLHAPFGTRVNRAWGLALRKRFCRSFNFELQAAATDDAIVLSLGTQHSFPLEEVFRYLNSKTVRDLLVQALLDAPMFPIRWRWNATRALALPRQRGGRKIAAPLQRMESENLLAAVFPDQLACPENLVGDREVPEHPLVQQTIADCLNEAMDLDGLIAVLRRIEHGTIRCIARDLPEPSPLAHAILNAKPYAFLDNAPLEERRTQAVYLRRSSDASSTDAGLGILDAAAIDKVCAEAWPRAANPDELHEALLLVGAMTDEDIQCTGENGRDVEHTPPFGHLSPEGTQAHAGEALKSPLERGGAKRRGVSSALDVVYGDACATFLPALIAEHRAGKFTTSRSAVRSFWIAAERLPLLQAVYPENHVEPPLSAPPAEAARRWERGDAVRELVRGRIEVVGPITATALADFFSLRPTEIEAALVALEAEGFVLRGKFRPDAADTEWCDRRLLARIHRLTIHRLRAEIQPVSIAEFQRFLLAWQRVDPEHRAEGPDGVRAVLELLDGYELPAAAWEPEVLALRVNEYTPAWLDQLCFTGRIGWGRLTLPLNQAGRLMTPVRSSPVSLYARENLPNWLALADGAAGITAGQSGTGLPTRVHEPTGQETRATSNLDFSPDTRTVWETLVRGGALFFGELVKQTGLLPSRVEQALAELAAQGCVTADSFEGMRALLVPEEKRASYTPTDRPKRHRSITSVEFAGRWSLLRAPASGKTSAINGNGHTADAHARDNTREAAIETFARVLLRRYGVVFRRMIERESLNASWFELIRVYRRLEARGEIRGGYFVSGVSGEQFALPDSIAMLRSIRKAEPRGEHVTISAADPLNLAGILTPGPRIAAIAAHRLLLRDGVPIAALKAGQMIVLDRTHGESEAIHRTLRVGRMPPALRPYYA